MGSRREFIKGMFSTGMLIGGGSMVASSCSSETAKSPGSSNLQSGVKPVFVSTWNHGLAANKAAMNAVSNGGTILDAVEAGVMVTESDPTNGSVGLGGRPDRDGNVTLDACIMNQEGDCGAVAFLQNIENPIRVARMVMENTPHVMLVGEGARQFAIEKGVKEIDLLTEDSEKAWKEWLKKSEYEPVINIENHDTIGMLGIDAEGNISGSCTTSGMAYKLHGRVGDSPIIGAGLFVDNDIGAACATGVGEAVIRVAGSHLVVEKMRQGMTPEEACKHAVERIIAKHKNLENLQVGFLALNKEGNHGGYAVYKGFDYALSHLGVHEMRDTKYYREWD